MSSQNAISPTRSEDYPEWYQQVVKVADLAENSVVRGCMVIKPWGYGIWELIQRELDDRIKATGHLNAYFPLLIPLSFFQREAEHVSGFAKECAIVTHHRLEERNGELVPAGELEEPLIIRPTSETIIGESFSKWVQSYRDLPLLINQWANVFRWEMRTRVFLRTAEFLWQEGHTVHATAAEANTEMETMLEVYREFAENVLALPVIAGEKPAHERFPGAVKTVTIEAMMQDRKALQAGTSHNLGQNFAKSSDIKFVDERGEIVYAHTTSWGVSSRLIGGVIMAHSDDDGLRLPPKIAPKQVVILPVIPKPELKDKVLEFCTNLANQIGQARYDGQPIRVQVDKRDMRGGEKNWEWIKRGIPVRIEVGPRDLEQNCAMLSRRDRGAKDKESVPVSALAERLVGVLSDMQKGYLESARKFQEAHTRSDLTDFNALKEFFSPKNAEKPEIHGGFVWAGWCAEPTTLTLLDDLKATIRIVSNDPARGKLDRCVLTGKPATTWALIAKSY